MTNVVMVAIGLSIILYLGIAVRYGFSVRGLGDILPLLSGGRASVNSHREFAASTVAATISLATVVIAFYELVPSLGLWLLWTAITTAAGLALFGILVPRIWSKFSFYDYRPTLHAYLGTEYNSPRLALVASICTAIGYLSAFAVELTVGSRFLAGLVEGIPQFLTVMILAAVAFVYTGIGGFRVVVVTDRIQMWFIWLLIAAMGFYEFFAASKQGWLNSLNRIPVELRTVKWNSGLAPFILGVAFMNLLTFVGNMGLWQRIAGSNTPEIVTRGMWSSVAGAAFSWSLLVILAVGGFMFVGPIQHENLLVTVLKSIDGSEIGSVVIFCVVLGLYGAMLSTSSTQLIAVSHTIYEDVLGPFRQASVRERAQLKHEAVLSRVVLVVCALTAVGVVEILRIWGFTIADLAFAVYGAALGLVPPVIVTLFVSRDITRRLSLQATLAVAFGFAAGWGAAGYGRAEGDGNLVFLSPLISTAVATAIMLTGVFSESKKPRAEQPEIVGLR